jgi:thiosulfate dehydrogenase [quinone] large subunit
MRRERITYLLGRLPVAMSMFGHGLDRLPKLEGFSNHMVQQFNNAMLPLALVEIFSHVLPFIEFITGVFLILGLFTRWSAIVGVLIMLALIFGSSMIEQWENVFTQIIYAICFALIYYFSAYNYYSLDQLFAIKKNVVRA